MSWCLHEGTDAKDSQGTRRRRKDRGAHPEEDPERRRRRGSARERETKQGNKGHRSPGQLTGERKEGAIRRKVMIMLFLLLF